MTVEIEYDDKIAVLHLGSDENRFSPAYLDDIEAAIDEVIAESARGLVTTAGGKFYTNGLDLEWLGAHADQGRWYIGRVHQLLARVLTCPYPPRPPSSVTPSAPVRCWRLPMTSASCGRTADTSACPRSTSGSLSTPAWWHSYRPSSPRRQRSRR